MSSDVTSKKAVVGVVAIVVVIGVLVWLVNYLMPAKPITAEITLQNNCDLPDSVFAVQVVPNGAKAAFSSTTERVRMQLMSTDRVKLIANDSRFKDYSYESPHVKASSSVILYANCDDSRNIGQISR